MLQVKRSEFADALNGASILTKSNSGTIPILGNVHIESFGEGEGSCVEIRATDTDLMFTRTVYTSPGESFKATFPGADSAASSRRWLARNCP